VQAQKALIKPIQILREIESRHDKLELRLSLMPRIIQRISVKMLIQRQLTSLESHGMVHADDPPVSPRVISLQSPKHLSHLFTFTSRPLPAIIAHPAARRPDR
jgi:hypothetical protein